MNKFHCRNHSSHTRPCFLQVKNASRRGSSVKRNIGLGGVCRTAGSPGLRPSSSRPAACSAQSERGSRLPTRQLLLFKICLRGYLSKHTPLCKTKAENCGVKTFTISSAHCSLTCDSDLVCGRTFCFTGNPVRTCEAMSRIRVET